MVTDINISGIDSLCCAGSWYVSNCSSVCPVVALYSYKASKPDDLSLTEGDIIYLMHRHDDGWWEGVLNGNRGFFPENYVQSSG